MIVEWNVNVINLDKGIHIHSSIWYMGVEQNVNFDYS